MDRRARELRAKKVAIAEKRADEVLLNRGLYDQLIKHAEAWERFERVHRYVAELSRRVSMLSGEEQEKARQWLDWCEAHLNDRNPMRRIETPQVEPPRGYERDDLVQQLADQITDEEVNYT